MHNINIWGDDTLFKIPMDKPIRLKKIYTVERKTVWSTIEPENLLVVVLKGKGHFKTGGNEYVLSENEGIFIPAGQEYERKFVDDKVATYVYFHFETENKIEEITTEQANKYIGDDNARNERSAIEGISAISLPTNDIIVNQYVRLSSEFNAVWTKLSKQLLSRHIESRFLCSVYFNEILGYAFKFSAKKLSSKINPSSANAIHHNVKKAVLYINQNYNKIITLEMLCDFCKVSPQHLIRLFKVHLNSTPTQYINRIKINYAKNLIQNHPNLSMKEIAFELGFENPHYFSRLFTKIEGRNPSDYKARLTIPEDKFLSGVATVEVRSKRTRKASK